MKSTRLFTIVAGALGMALVGLTPVARAQVGAAGQPQAATPMQDSIRGRITAVQLNAQPPRIEIAAQDGQRVQVQVDPDQTDVMRNGQSVEPQALQVGQVVEVEHTAQGDQAMADTIDIVQAGASAVDPGPPTRLNPALDAPDVQRAPGDRYSAGDKLVRGVANVFTGFIEVPRNIYNTTREENMLMGWTIGLAKGLGYTGLRMGTGLYETVTFPFELPAEYRPIVLPEFPWQARGPDYI